MAIFKMANVHKFESSKFDNQPHSC